MGSGHRLLRINIKISINITSIPNLLIMQTSLKTKFNQEVSTKERISLYLTFQQFGCSNRTVVPSLFSPFSSTHQQYPVLAQHCAGSNEPSSLQCGINCPSKGPFAKASSLVFSHFDVTAESTIKKKRFDWKCSYKKNQPKHSAQFQVQVSVLIPVSIRERSDQM